MENKRKHGNIKLAATEKCRNNLVSKLNYHTTKFLSKHLSAIEIKTHTQVLVNKLVYLGLSILQISQTVKYQFWCDYVK